MLDKYRFLKMFEMSGTPMLFPLYERLKSLQSERFTNEEWEEEVVELKKTGYIEDLAHGRIGLTKAGMRYLDEVFWLKQTYDIVDNALIALVDRNTTIGFDHVRRVLRIEQKAKKIMSDYELVRYWGKPLGNYFMAEITETGRNALGQGGIEDYLKGLEEVTKKQAAIEEEKGYLQAEKLMREVTDLRQRQSNYQKQMEKFEIDFTNARRIEQDYPVVKQRAKWSLIIAGFALIVSLLTLILRLIHLPQS